MLRNKNIVNNRKNDLKCGRHNLMIIIRKKCKIKVSYLDFHVIETHFLLRNHRLRSNKKNSSTSELF